MYARAQFSLEFLVFAAAFFAFLALFASVGRQAFEKSVFLSNEVSAEEKLAGVCFYIDFFSLDGLHSFSQKNFEGFSSQGRRLFFENHSVECNSQFRFEGSVLKVESNAIEVR